MEASTSLAHQTRARGDASVPVPRTTSPTLRVGPALKDYLVIMMVRCCSCLKPTICPTSEAPRICRDRAQ